MYLYLSTDFTIFRPLMIGLPVKHKTFLHLLELTKADSFGFMCLSCKHCMLFEPLIIIAGLYECR